MPRKRTSVTRTAGPSARRPAKRKSPRSAPGPRQPRQERGEERVTAILDATAALLQEEGPAGVTVHGIARRARTAIGSFYHFFPSLQSVYLELVERYTRGMALAEEETAGVSNDAWRAMAPAEAVETTFVPINRLLDRHGYVAALRTIPSVNQLIVQREQESASRGHQIAGRLIAARNPRLSAGIREAATAVFLGTLRGGFEEGRHLSPPTLITEIKRALTAQLEALDRL